MRTGPARRRRSAPAARRAGRAASVGRGAARCRPRCRRGRGTRCASAPARRRRGGRRRCRPRTPRTRRGGARDGGAWRPATGSRGRGRRGSRPARGGGARHRRRVRRRPRTSAAAPVPAARADGQHDPDHVGDPFDVQRPHVVAHRRRLVGDGDDLTAVDAPGASEPMTRGTTRSCGGRVVGPPIDVTSMGISSSVASPVLCSHMTPRPAAPRSTRSSTSVRAELHGPVVDDAAARVDPSRSTRAPITASPQLAMALLVERRRPPGPPRARRPRCTRRSARSRSSRRQGRGSGRPTDREPAAPRSTPVSPARSGRTGRRSPSSTGR